MTAEKGREKAEEVLGVLQDMADDLLVEAGEEAVEGFWRRMDDYFSARRFKRFMLTTTVDLISPMEWARRYAPQRLAEMEQGLAFLRNPNSASTSATPDTAGTPSAPAGSSASSPAD